MTVGGAPSQSLGIYRRALNMIVCSIEKDVNMSKQLQHGVTSELTLDNDSSSSILGISYLNEGRSE